MVTEVAFFAHDALDAAVQRRIVSFKAAGANVLGFTMRRGSAVDTPWENIDLGLTQDAAFVQRLAAMLRAIPALVKHRARLAAADVIYARNLDMLLLAQLAKWLAGARANLVYECLDVHRFLPRQNLLGATLRAVEGALLKRTSRVVVSSPAFCREHLELRYPGRFRAVLVENRMPEGFDYGPRPDPKAAAPEGSVLRIGWFGNLRCRRSLELLLDTADQLPDRVRIILHGTPTSADLPDFHDRIAGRTNVDYGGRYKWPDDLAELYSSVDLVWAGDFHDPGANSAWLLPNRLYEGGYYGVPAIAPKDCEAGRWIEDRGFGFVVAEPLEEALPGFLGGVGWDAVRTARHRLLTAATDKFIQPLDGVKDLLAATLEPSLASDR
jgi:succinoglycan biosynthesis protein ExoL